MSLTYDPTAADGVLLVALVFYGLVVALALGVLRHQIARRGHRCPRCLRPWDAVDARSWGDLEVAARRERRAERR
uniref:Uncharacterized protein n=1 Tax=uncultured prokaryote TaxID=198431 RepID=A0A0H5QKQ6_9ZZZZ|nr:hypothetical protein [uncultured prokaryote]